ncbi:hypothetical protein NW759_017151 [Fusarium solani]|uniref:Glucose-methanol-choline oxidoreductase N-terminal domain-containing protein n=1 Tax=Fusarium falciforme TaxID=195108 RepID=A0A9W8QTV8_9HYPO|nr:hypothetical protein NW755_014568 [Fusarium falciforme]KAJ4182096.1 hypothetical protein NW759_017151 [Fusarium solani]
MSSNISHEEIVAKAHHFVIVGGGTAGLVLAGRLSEDPAVNVLVLEAGENRLGDPKIDIPALMTQLYEDPAYDWSFKSTQQHALNDRVVAQPRGKLLGGSSGINFMMAAYPSARDIDNWEKLGNPGWNWASLLPYYRKSEAFNQPSAETKASLGGDVFDPEMYGKDGPVQLTLPHGTSQIDAAWTATLKNLGLEVKQDPREGRTLGGYAVLKFIDQSAKRSYAASAYYAPNAARKNLAVITGAHVNKVILEAADGDGVRARAVSFTVLEKGYTVYALNEIILSAGTVQSPQILELSGIGGAQILSKAGIKVVVENPNVGENLQDHPLVPLTYEARDGLPTAETIRQPGVLDWAMGEWQAGRGGPLASGVSGTSFLLHKAIADASRVSKLLELSATRSTLKNTQFDILKELLADEKEADVQINFAAAGFNPYIGESMAGLFPHADSGNYLGSVAVINHPFSRGATHITGTSSDPKAHPTIDPSYLSNEVDFQMMVDGLLFIQKIMETAPMADMVKANDDGGGKKIQPGYKISRRLDRAAAEKLVRDATISSWHLIGTCSMMPRSAGGVVDHRLRVYGVQRLRVVDASVMPLHVRGNIASSVYAIAERAADMIKEDWKIGAV